MMMTANKNKNNKNPQEQQRLSRIKSWIQLLIAFLAGIQVHYLLIGATNTNLECHDNINNNNNNNANPPVDSSLLFLGPPSTFGSRSSSKNNNKNPDFQLANDQSYGFFSDISTTHWKLAQQRARHRQNHRFFAKPFKFYAMDSISRWLMNNFEPEFTCAHERRMGGVGDGPKWVCDPHRLIDIARQRKLKRLQQQQKTLPKASTNNANVSTLHMPLEEYRALDLPVDCLIYSIGCGGKWHLEDALYELLGNACQIHIFDPGFYAKDRPQDFTFERNWFFHKWGLKSSYDTTFKPTVNYGEFFTLQETMERLGHVNKTIDIFKVDCEGCEWQSYKDWFGPHLDIRQMLIETHDLPTDRNVGMDYFLAFQRNHYYMFHKEPNIHPRSAGRGIEWGYVKLHPDFFPQQQIARKD